MDINTAHTSCVTDAVIKHLAKEVSGALIRWGASSQMIDQEGARTSLRGNRVVLLPHLEAAFRRTPELELKASAGLLGRARARNISGLCL